jgi:3-oxoacyl-[acyl-carrier-protein] synthase
MTINVILEDAVTSSARTEASLVGLRNPLLDIEWDDSITGTEKLIECVRMLAASAKDRGMPISGKIIIFTGSQCHGADKRTAEYYPPSPLAAIREIFSDAIVKQVTVSHACASTGIAIGLAADMCRSGNCDAAIVCATSMEGGIEERAFREARALGTQLRPFDREADGTRVFGFAGALLIRAHSQPKEGAIAILGWHARSVGGLSGSDSEEELCVMSTAVEKSGSVPTVIFAHATGTIQGDTAEIEAITSYCDKFGKTVTVIGNKGALGHAVFGAGVASASSALRLMEGNSIIGMVGLTHPRSTDQNVRLTSESTKFDIASNSLLLNCFGFGGSNVSIVLERVENDPKN